jgi:hypothetical protein
MQWSKGYVRLAHFDTTTISNVLFNFGLKLYQQQSKHELIHWLGPDHVLIKDAEELSSSLPQAMFKARSVLARLDREKLMKRQAWGVLDKNFDHTEFEVMRKMYGDIEADNLV